MNQTIRKNQTNNKLKEAKKLCAAAELGDNSLWVCHCDHTSQMLI